MRREERRRGQMSRADERRGEESVTWFMNLAVKLMPNLTGTCHIWGKVWEGARMGKVIAWGRQALA